MPGGNVDTVNDNKDYDKAYAFWGNRGFAVRGDLVYRSKNITELIRIDT
ncbi:hypothetical protein SAMN02745217_01812 [Anaerocolumna xylanovorans DSM 12503]|uniref:Uncharacterized protein n=1 Tax=Anaerocolumna xylanovorans DSM 12503 TaxID=1121345 RepID=A0A1M7Y704_9FIRM|nr:hypothetical protein SAMN02745217_01812 [Anaerocolumna xylanovorans DSM 12503]